MAAAAALLEIDAHAYCDQDCQLFIWSYFLGHQVCEYTAVTQYRTYEIVTLEIVWLGEGAYSSCNIAA
jgi:hypothetical protein